MVMRRAPDDSGGNIGARFWVNARLMWLTHSGNRSHGSGKFSGHVWFSVPQRWQLFQCESIPQHKDFWPWHMLIWIRNPSHCQKYETIQNGSGMSNQEFRYFREVPGIFLPRGFTAYYHNICFILPIDWWEFPIFFLASWDANPFPGNLKVVVSNIFFFSPGSLGRWSTSTSIFFKGGASTTNYIFGANEILCQWICFYRCPRVLCRQF